MVRKLFYASFVMIAAVGIVVADEATGRITNVDGKAGTFTFQKTKKGKDDGEAIAMKLAKDGKVLKGVPKGKGKVEPGDPIEGGLGNELFQKAKKGVNARVTYEGTTASQVLVIAGKKKKKAAE